MASTFYLSSTETTALTPGFGATTAWGRTTEGDRYVMRTTKDASAFASKTTGGGANIAADVTMLNRQYVSLPMNAGIAFVTTDTIKCYIRCCESGANDNVNRQPINVKVYDTDGTTLRATLKDTAHIGPNTTEEDSSTLTNEALADGDALAANYTTEAGDYLVIEVGQQVSASGGSGVTATMEFGTNSANALAEDSTSQDQYCPWFYISRTVTFRTSPAANKPRLGLLSRRAPGRFFKALLGLKSTVKKGLKNRIYRALNGLLSTFAQLKIMPQKNYAYDEKPLLGLLSLRIKKIATKISPALLGLLPKRVKGSIRKINALAGLLSTAVKKPNKKLVGLLGIISLRKKRSFATIKPLLGLLPKRVLKVIRSIRPLMGLSSSISRKLSRTNRPLIGLYTTTRKKVSRKVSTLLGIMATRIKKLSRMVKPLLGIYSAVGKRMGKINRVLLGLKPLMKKGSSTFKKALLGLISVRTKWFRLSSYKPLLGLRATRNIGVGKDLLALTGLIGKLLSSSLKTFDFVALLGVKSFIVYPFKYLIIAFKGLISLARRRVDWRRTPRRDD